MSHFVVLVIGDDIEDQLAPYDENMSVEEYITHDVYIPKEHADKPVVEQLDIVQSLYADDGEKYFIDEDQVSRMSRYNSDSKWDWFQIGGRWTGFFKLKPGAVGVVGEKSWASETPAEGRVDQLIKGDLDIQGMREEAAVEAGERYDKVRKIMDAHPKLDSWAFVCNKYPDDIDSARAEYNGQPALVALHNNNLVGWGFDPEEYDIPRDDYVQDARNQCILPFAVLDHGVWKERGKMGWFGFSHDEQNRGQWAREFNNMFNALPDDTLLTAVDCHI